MKKIWSQFYLNSSKLVNSTFFRFAVSGAVSAGFEMASLILMVERLHIHLYIANVIAFTVTNVLNYLLSRYWVFEKSNKRVHVEASLFFIVTGIGLAINQFFLCGF